MILKLKITSKAKDKKRLVVWIQRKDIIQDDVMQIIHFFKEQIEVSIVQRIHSYYKITSENPAIMLSLLSAFQELIPDLFFNDQSQVDLKETFNSF